MGNFTSGLEEYSAKSESSVIRPVPSTSSQGSESEQKNLSDKSDLCDKSREPEKETPDDIGKQVCLV